MTVHRVTVGFKSVRLGKFGNGRPLVPHEPGRLSRRLRFRPDSHPVARRRRFPPHRDLVRRIARYRAVSSSQGRREVTHHPDSIRLSQRLPRATTGSRSSRSPVRGLRPTGGRSRMRRKCQPVRGTSRRLTGRRVGRFSLRSAGTLRDPRRRTLDRTHRRVRSRASSRQYRRLRTHRPEISIRSTAFSTRSTALGLTFVGRCVRPSLCGRSPVLVP